MMLTKIFLASFIIYLIQSQVIAKREVDYAVQKKSRKHRRRTADNQNNETQSGFSFVSFKALLDANQNGDLDEELSYVNQNYNLSCGHNYTNQYQNQEEDLGYINRKSDLDVGTSFANHEDNVNARFSYENQNDNRNEEFSYINQNFNLDSGSIYANQNGRIDADPKQNAQPDFRWNVAEETSTYEQYEEDIFNEEEYEILRKIFPDPQQHVGLVEDFVNNETNENDESSYINQHCNLDAGSIYANQNGCFGADPKRNSHSDFRSNVAEETSTYEQDERDNFNEEEYEILRQMFPDPQQHVGLVEDFVNNETYENEEEFVNQFLNLDEFSEENNSIQTIPDPEHNFVRIEGKSHQVRSYCKQHKANFNNHKLVRTKCEKCDEPLCPECYKRKHRLANLPSAKPTIPAQICYFCKNILDNDPDTMVEHTLNCKKIPRILMENRLARFACFSDKCGFQTNDKFVMTTHIRSHSGHRPYICRFCKRPFTTNNNRERHIRSRHKQQ